MLIIATRGQWRESKMENEGYIFNKIWTPVERFTTENVDKNICTYEEIGIMKLDCIIIVFKLMMEFIINKSDAGVMSCEADAHCKTKGLC